MPACPVACTCTNRSVVNRPGSRPAFCRDSTPRTATDSAPRSRSSTTWPSSERPGRNAAEIFEHRRGVWLRRHRLKPSLATADFGTEVAFDGTSVFIGAPETDSVFIFHRQPQLRPFTGIVGSTAPGTQSSWPEIQILRPADSEHFGASIALDESRALIGAPDDDDEGTAYIFERLGESVWLQSQQLIPNALASEAEFGSSVALKGTRAVVGAPSFDEQFGTVHLFELQANGWQETEQLDAVVSTTGEGQFGTYVALYGKEILTSIGIDDALPFGVYVGTVLVWQPSARQAMTITSFNPGIPKVNRNNTISATPNELSTSAGGSYIFRLDAGEAYAFQSYQLLGSLSGTQPGTTFGALELPLNPDPYFNSTLFLPISTPITEPIGQLDAKGRADVVFTLPPNAATPLTGLTLSHAFAVFPRERLTGFASNPVSLELVP